MRVRAKQLRRATDPVVCRNPKRRGPPFLFAVMFAGVFCECRPRRGCAMLTTRPIVRSDLDVICRHRQAMFREAGRDNTSLAAMAALFRHWLDVRLTDGSYFGYVVEDDARPVAGIGLMVIDWPPHPSHPADDRRGYVLNLYVDPSHRGRGLARGLMKDAERAFAERGVRHLVLHATDMARPIYEHLAWTPTAELAKTLR